MPGHAVTNHVVYSTNLNSERWLSVSIRGCFLNIADTANLAITCKMLGFTQPTSAKLHRLSLIEGNGSLLSSNRLVLRLTDKMRYVQAVSLKRSYR